MIRPTEQRFPKSVKANQMYFIKMNGKNNQKWDEIENTENLIPISRDIMVMIESLWFVDYTISIYGIFYFSNINETL